MDELNSRVGLNGEAYKKVLVDMMPNDMFDIIFNKYGTIPSNENDLKSVVIRAGIIIEERELARPKRAQHNPSPSGSKDKGKDAGKGKETEKSSPPQKGANTQGKQNKGPPLDKYPDQEILWASFADAMKDVPPEEFQQHQEADANCRRCRRNTPKRRASFTQKTIAGTKLPEPPKMPAGKAALAGTKRMPDQEEPERNDQNKKAKVASTTTQKIWEVSESETDTEMADF